MAKGKQLLMEDLELGEMILDPTKENEPDSCYKQIEISGLRSDSFSEEYCCIYRVPNKLRRLKPEAYIPEALLIGHLHHSKKAQTFDQLSKTDLRYLEYKKMEHHKKNCLTYIESTFGNQTVQEFRKIIQKKENFIRKSYAESTNRINSEDFVEMTLLDSVFILVFFLQIGTRNFTMKGDILFEVPYLINTILEDLILLENQLPFVLLEELFEPFFANLKVEGTFHDITLRAFGFQNIRVGREVKFRHFTDLFRGVYVETLGSTEERTSSAKDEPLSIKSLHNAENLYRAGVDFVNVNGENDLSLMIDFEDGILKMPCFIVEDNTEKTMRNLMALEQCHYPHSTYICNYIAFLNFLFKTDQDVELLVKKGVVKNSLTSTGSVREMVEKLCSEIVNCDSHYYHIAESLNEYYKNPYIKKDTT